VTDRKHPSVAFWITVALVAVLMGYPLSIGPAHGLACWIHSPRVWRITHAAYRPFAIACGRCRLDMRVVFWYVGLWEWKVPEIEGTLYPPGFDSDIID
jgi:hypothetical protein